VSFFKNPVFLGISEKHILFLGKFGHTFGIFNNALRFSKKGENESSVVFFNNKKKKP